MFAAPLRLVTLPILLGLALVARADTLELTDGQSISGSFAGGSANNLRFRTDGGTETFPRGDVDSVFFERDPDSSGPDTASGSSGGSDSLELKDGTTLTGSYAGGTSNNIRFNSGGTRYTYPLGGVAALFLSGGAAASAPAAAPAPAPTPKTAPAPTVSMVVPAGSRVMVRLSQSIDSRRQQAGFRFTGRLEGDLLADNGETVAPRGSTVYGILTNARQSGRVAGRSELTLTLTDILVNNQMRPVVTSDVNAVTENTAGRTARRTLGAAAIGGLIDGRSGARTGAAVGAGASILTQGNTINIPSGTLLEFRLGQPFSG